MTEIFSGKSNRQTLINFENSFRFLAKDRLYAVTMEFG